jgi:peptidoglycan hydrolase-like protein with peptidoglycan-binding domain
MAAAALVLATVVSGIIPPATTAAAAPGGQESAAADPAGALDQGGGLYPLTAVPRPATGPIPLGKGMWVHKLGQVTGGNPQLLVDQAKAAGLTHVYVRLGSSKSGFYARGDLNALLPVAHAAGLKVVGWDFPYLGDVAADVRRAREEIWHMTPSGDRIDGFSPDIETASEGTHLSAAAVQQYGAGLRAEVGAGYPLVATVPRPSNKRWFPYDALGDFDAIAPMVYWGNRDPAADVAGAIAALAPLGKPVLPIGQAYDMAVDRGPAGPPDRKAIERFIQSATDHGALGVSFWVWDQATAEHWLAISQSAQLDLGAAAKPAPAPSTVAYLQRVLTGLGHPAPVDGHMTAATQTALAEVQRHAGLPATGKLDQATVQALVGPTN